MSYLELIGMPCIDPIVPGFVVYYVNSEVKDQEDKVDLMPSCNFCHNSLRMLSLFSQKPNY